MEKFSGGKPPPNSDSAEILLWLKVLTAMALVTQAIVAVINM